MKIKVGLLVFLTILLIGCGNDSLENDNSNNRKNKTFYESGELKSENDFTDRIKEGEEIIYYKSGKVKKKYNYHNDKLHGLYVSFNENGAMKQSSRYLKGELSGCVKNFYKSGEPKEVALFYKDSQLCFGELDINGEANTEDFFVDVEIPDVVLIGDDLQMAIKLYNADFFADCNLVEGTYTEDGKGLIKGDEKIIENNVVKVTLSSDALGFQDWSGTIKCTAKEDSTKYAAYPIHIAYKVVKK